MTTLRFVIARPLSPAWMLPTTIPYPAIARLPSLRVGLECFAIWRLVLVFYILVSSAAVYPIPPAHQSLEGQKIEVQPTVRIGLHRAPGFPYSLGDHPPIGTARLIASVPRHQLETWHPRRSVVQAFRTLLEWQRGVE